jgi:hypothetical protein
VGTALGLGFGVGLLLVWSALSSPRAVGPRTRRDRSRLLLDAAGLPGT